MKYIYKIILFITLILSSALIVFATLTTASIRKSNKLPWQGILTGSFDSSHNVGYTNIEESRFSSVSVGVVADSITGLYWQGIGNTTGFNWQDSKQYCDDLVLDGIQEWRLPNIKELSSIISFDKQGMGSVGLDTTFFINNIGFFWSSTPLQGFPNHHYIYATSSFGTETHNIDTSTNPNVRCVN